MMTSYRTGTWTAVVNPAGLALLSPDFPADTVRSLWEAMRAGRPLSAWLETIADGGIAGLPDFALARTEGDQVRILVRGQVHVSVDDTTIQAQGMSTWREHVGPVSSVVQLSAPEDAGQSWPLTGGVVLAAAVRTGADDDPPAGPVPGSTADRSRSEGAGSVPEQEQEQEQKQEQDDDAASVAAEPAEGRQRPEVEAVVLPALSAEQAQEGPGFTEADRAGIADDDAAEPGDAGTPGDDEAAPDGVEDVHADDDLTDADKNLTDAPGDDHGGVIDSLPWDVPALRADQEPSTSLEATVIPTHDGPGIEHPRPEDPAEHPGPDGPQPEVPDNDGDHDGHTVLVAHLRSARDGAQSSTDGQGTAETDVQDDTVLSSTDDTASRPTPSLLLSTGQRVELDRAALIGRAPEASRFEGSHAPHLVPVPSPEQDISRTHVEVKPEGDHVVVTDLRSTNGTIVTLPGADARRLHPGEAIPVGHGAVIDLGDGITGEVQIGNSGPEPVQPSPADAVPPPPAGGPPSPPPASAYGQPPPYGQPAPYGGQPPPYGQPAPYGHPPVPPGPGVPPVPPAPYGYPRAGQGGAG